MRRIRQLDGVRALAMLIVFVRHAYGVKGLWLGVELFFVLSGFLITGLLLDAKENTFGSLLKHFYARRARRILVPYVVFLTLASLFVGIGWMRHWYYYILLTNLLLPLGIPHPNAFIPLWSLAVEEQFYLLWPFAVYFLDTRRLRQLCIALIVVAPILRGVCHFASQSPIYHLTPFRMDLLAAGGLMSVEWRLNRERLQQFGSRVGIPMSLVGLAGLGLLWRFGVRANDNTRVGNVFIYEAILVACSGFMLYALGGRRVELLKIAPLTYIGQISYSMYLVHVGMIEIASRWVHGLAIGAVAMAMTIAYAAISWSVLESKLLKRKRPEGERELVPA